MDLTLMETTLGIRESERWTPSHPEYQATLEYANTRNYHQALDRLQKLVIQRLFELHKLNLNFTGWALILLII